MVHMNMSAEERDLQKTALLLQQLGLSGEVDKTIQAEAIDEDSLLFAQALEQQPAEFGSEIEVVYAGRSDNSTGFPSAATTGATEVEDFLIGALLHPLVRQHLGAHVLNIPGEDIFINSPTALVIYKELQTLERKNLNLRLSPAAIAAHLQKNTGDARVVAAVQDAHKIFLFTLAGANAPVLQLINSPFYTPESLQYVERMFQDYLSTARKAASRQNLENAFRNALNGLNQVSSDKLDGFLEKTQDTLWPLLNATSSGKEYSANEVATAEDVLLSIRDGVARHQEAVLTQFEETNVFKDCAGLSTGFSELDGVLNGLIGGDVIVLAARPSIGKTDFAIAVTDAVLQQKKAVAFVTLEMPKEQLGVRFLAKYSGLTGKAITNGLFRDATEMSALNDAAKLFGQLKLTVMDNTDDSDIFGILRSVAKLVAEGQCDFLVLDYIQLLDGAIEGMRNSTREGLISYFSRAIKRFAKKFNIPVLLLSQLNRDVDKRGSTNKRPQLTDLRESGSLEQDASAVIMMYREDRASKDADQNQPQAQPTDIDPVVPVEIILRKNRNGPLDTLVLNFDGRYSRWTLPD